MTGVRPAVPADADAIRRIHLAAFATAAEADLVERLEEQGDSVVSLVAEDRAEMVGHVLLSRMKVTADGAALRGLGLGPVAVRPDRQRGGIGSALIEQALSRARAGGEVIVFVVGDPAYYGRFGFSVAAAAPFESPYAGPYFMALALTELPLPVSGRADYAPAFAAL